MTTTPNERIDAVITDGALGTAIEQIAEMARVPPENRPQLIKHLKSSVAVMWRFAERVELFSASDVKKSAKRLALAAEEFGAAMAADEGALEFIRLGIAEPRPQSLTDYQAMTTRLAAAAKRAAASRGREPWRLFRQMFREWFVRDVADAGGNLTLNQRHPDRSTLIAALRLLAPFLPPEFSEKHSFSTLLRLKRGVKKNGNRAKNT